jgi:hypothetical protein
MNVTLDRKDLLYLVNGIQPDYSIFDNELVKKSGSYCGGFVDKWSWDYRLNELNDQELWDLYVLCKNSWNKKS